mmetsp:Transcript_5354/g.11840  ORF Transcript_5354/g.11840 Transcript_5354/m.11840 type:complete len:317 (+) Transcript_5354:126-1076(+)
MGRRIIAKRPADHRLLKAPVARKIIGKRPVKNLTDTVTSVGRVIAVGDAQIAGQAELQAQWKAIYGNAAVQGEKELRAILSRLPLTYASADGREYKVSRATVQDCSALCALGDEFVRMHTAVVSSDSQPANQANWCTYLGLHPDHSQREKAYSVVAPKHDLVRQTRSSTLKCELIGTRERNGELRLPNGEAAPEIVGYIHFKLEEVKGARCSKRLKRQRGESTGEYTKVTHVVVAPEHRRVGLAKLMLLAVACALLEQQASHLCELFLTVAKCNEAAVRLYKNLGFTVIGQNQTRPSQDVKPIDWLQMRVLRVEAV